MNLCSRGLHPKGPLLCTQESSCNFPPPVLPLPAPTAGVLLLSVCGGSGTASDPKTVTLGSKASDAVPKKAFADICAAYKTKSGISTDPPIREWWTTTPRGSGGARGAVRTSP
ncbi:hypothetical protein GCM10023097_28190 [Streptomyces collinus]